MELKNNFLEQAYACMEVSNSKELWEKYVQEDQRLLLTRKWDYKNQDLLINKVTRILEQIDISTLPKDQADDVNDMLWFWYHHAIGYAIWGHKNPVDAKEFSKRALSYQIDSNHNKITRLLYLLTHDREEEANKWIQSITKDPDKSAAEGIMVEYKNKKFYS